MSTNNPWGQQQSGWGTSAPGWGTPAPQQQSSWGTPPVFEDNSDESTDKIVKRVTRANPANPREVGVVQLELINRYHRNVLQQARQSFLAALIAAGVGLIFFIIAVLLVILDRSMSISSTSLISGGLVEVISAINFYLYGKASTQLVSFHVYLDRTHRFLLANSICENIIDEKTKDSTRSELIRQIMDMPSKEGLRIKPLSSKDSRGQ